MDSVPLAHAKERLKELIERATRGEDVRIGDLRGHSVRLVPLDRDEQRASRVVLGQWKHISEISLDRMLEPLSLEKLDWLSGEQSAT